MFPGFLSCLFFPFLVLTIFSNHHTQAKSIFSNECPDKYFSVEEMSLEKYHLSENVVLPPGKVIAAVQSC